MALDQRITGLVAIAASVGANCQPCLEYHRNKALQNGTAEAEITEAIEIGKAVRKGAANHMDIFAASLSGRPATVRGGEGCGCGS